MQCVPIVPKKPLRLAACALCFLCGMAWAQTAPVPPQATQPPVEQGSTDWRQANEEVGRFKRGHADVLKWEAANAQAPGQAPYAPPDVWIKSADAAVRMTWKATPDTAASVSRLSAQDQEHLAQGRWLALDPALHLRVEGFDALQALAAHARQAWLKAVAAKLALQHQRDMQEAAEAAAELARRMARVGNWSRMEQAQWQSKLGRIKLATLHAEIEARQTQSALLQATRLWGQASSVGLAEAMPDIPKEALSPAALQQHLTALRTVLPRAEARMAATHAEQAYAIYSASHQASQIAAEELSLQQFINDEVVLRYNGMLLSVWDLLTHTGELLEARIGAVHAQRDFLMAEAELQQVLLGKASAADQ